MTAQNGFTDNMITDAEVKAYLGIDYEDDMVEANIELAKTVAAEYLNSAVGEHVSPTSARAKLLMLSCIMDIYDNREFTVSGYKASCTLAKMIADFCLQLRLEGRE